MTDIKILKAAGLSEGQIVRVLECEQAAEKERMLEKRERDRIRKRNQRARPQCPTDAADKKERKKEGFPDLPKKERKKEYIYTPDFEKFWKAYPKRVAKKTAERALAIALREVSIDTITEALARQTPLWDPKFTPHPATWLNAGRWADEVPGARPKVVVTEEEMAILRLRYEEKQKRAL